VIEKLAESRGIAGPVADSGPPALSPGADCSPHPTNKTSTGKTQKDTARQRTAIRIFGYNSMRNIIPPTPYQKFPCKTFFIHY
jgi:hypothetical protein